jgi:hypothetical protein
VSLRERDHPEKLVCDEGSASASEKNGDPDFSRDFIGTWNPIPSFILRIH